MTMQRVNDIHRVVRELAFDNLWPDVGICFSLQQTDDAGPGQYGDLFHQNRDFLMVEVETDAVRKSGPGRHSPNRVWGGVTLTYHTKDRLDAVGPQYRLEEAGDWYAQQTLSGVRFREFVPTGDGRDRGFQWYSATLAFEFETQPKELNHG